MTVIAFNLYKFIGFVPMYWTIASEVLQIFIGLINIKFGP